MSWAMRRQFAYLSMTLIVIGAIVFAIVHKATSVPPTCFDHKKNGDEVGVDCGGGCLMYCPNELANPKVRWVRSFEITPGVVHAVAYIEHSYVGASAKNVQYQFKLYDDKNSLIATREGTTYIGPIGRSAIVETLIPTGNIPIANTRFSFVGPISWQKVDPEFSQVVIKTDKTNLESYEGGTRLTVTLDNQSKYSFSDMDVVAFLYDNADNAITVSKILVPSLGSLSKEDIYFTWPTKIPKESVRNIEVVPRINVFSSSDL